MSNQWRPADWLEKVKTRSQPGNFWPFNTGRNARPSIPGMGGNPVASKRVEAQFPLCQLFQTFIERARKSAGSPGTP